MVSSSDLAGVDEAIRLEAGAFGVIIGSVCDAWWR